MTTKWVKVLDTKFYTEGPGLDRAGNLYFTTLQGKVVLKRDADGKVSQWAALTCPNGQRIMEDGSHLICETGEKSIVKLDDQGALMETMVHMNCGGYPFEAPNDLILDKDEGLYFTDSVRYIGQVFYISKKGEEKRVLSDLDYPNGIAISADGQNLFIAESYTNRILTVRLEEPGIPMGKPEVFAELPFNPSPPDSNRMPFTSNLPDGIAFDDTGFLWVAHYGMGALQVLNPDGSLERTVPTGIPATSNLIFDSTFENIYVTGGSSEPGPGMVHKVIIEK